MFSKYLSLILLSVLNALLSLLISLMVVIHYLPIASLYCPFFGGKQLY